jgi:hypothetical protein
VRRSWLRLFWAGVVVAAAAVGYLATSDLGERLLHQEIETQLSRLLSGPVEIAEVELRFADGLRLEARGLEAYRSPDPEGGPALRASRVLAWIDILALLVGRLELSTLILDGLQLRIEQAADGSFPELPLPRINARSEGERVVSIAEQLAQQLEWLDPAATAFAKRFRAADRIEILDGSVTWIDRRNLSAEGMPRELRLELISGVAERDWLSDGIAVDWRAVFVDGRHAPFPIEIGVHRDEGPHFEWTASFSQVPLDFTEPINGLEGTLDARFHFTTSVAGERSLRFDGVIENATISLRQSQTIIQQGNIELRAEFDIDDKRLRISEGHVNGPRLGLDFKGVIDRPIRPTSRVRIESRMVGVGIDDIRNLAGRLEPETDLARALTLLTARIESGNIRHIEAAGTARLQQWQDLAAGRTREVPDGFLLGGAVDQMVIGSGSNDPLEDLSGEFEWVEDQVSLRNMNAIYNGTQLPEMNALIDGVSHLIRAADSARVMAGRPGPVPGLTPLIQIFKRRNPNSLPPVKAIGLAIDYLEHPLFRWPLRDVRVLVEPLRSGLQMNIREGTWAGTAISGDLVWFNDPNAPSVSVQLTMGPHTGPSGEQTTLDAGDEGAPDSSTAGNTRPADRWAAGRFELEFRPRPRLPFKRGIGFFRLDGSRLLGNEIEIELETSGRAALHAEIDLREPESIGLDLSFAITEATFADMSEFVVMPADLVTGDVGATGSLAGRVRPRTSFVAELDGRVRVEAQNGRIATTLPLLLRLGKASEGYNPFANSDELRYESMTATIALDHGKLSTEDFEIEGPLRVFANAQLDTNRRPGAIRAVVGIFLFRTSGEFLGNLPLVRSFLPGSERGLIGAYFEVDGPLDEPRVEALPLQTLMSSVPGAIKAPFKVLRLLFGREEKGS